MSRERTFRSFFAFAGAIMLVWAAAYGYLNYRTDQCISNVQARLNVLQETMTMIPPYFLFFLAWKIQTYYDSCLSNFQNLLFFSKIF
jgi:hypothetical protein